MLNRSLILIQRSLCLLRMWFCFHARLKRPHVSTHVSVCRTWTSVCLCQPTSGYLTVTCRSCSWAARPSTSRWAAAPAERLWWETAQRRTFEDSKDHETIRESERAFTAAEEFKMWCYRITGFGGWELQRALLRKYRTIRSLWFLRAFSLKVIYAELIQRKSPRGSMLKLNGSNSKTIACDLIQARTVRFTIRSSSIQMINNLVLKDPVE